MMPPNSDLGTLYRLFLSFIPARWKLVFAGTLRDNPPLPHICPPSLLTRLWFWDVLQQSVVGVHTCVCLSLSRLIRVTFHPPRVASAMHRGGGRKRYTPRPSRVSPMGAVVVLFL